MNKGEKKLVYAFEKVGSVLAGIVSVALIGAACLMIYHSFSELLLNGDVKVAVQDGLFVLILLEMLTIIRSYLKYRSVNISLVINVGFIATLKQLVFEMESMTLEIAAAFGMIILTLAVAYYIESRHFEAKKEE